MIVDESVAVIIGAPRRLTRRSSTRAGERGWPGDSPLIHLDCSRIRALGWKPTLTIEQAIVRTLDWLEQNPYAVPEAAAVAMSVIFSRAPLRISLGGGGTDLPSYYREHGGFLVSGAIDKYVYMLTHTVFQRRYLMKYAQTEEVDDAAEIRHPILREALLRHWRGNPLEIASVADVPAGTGMGSSGAFAVCLLKALAQARSTSDHPGRAGRGGLRDRDRRPEGAGRKAGHLRRRARWDLQLHLPSRRERRRRTRSSSRPRRCAGCVTTSCCSTPARPAPRRPC